MLPLAELLCNFLSYAAPYLVMLHSWAMLHTAEFYAALYWAALQPTDIHSILFWASLCPLSATLHPLSYDAPHWAVLHSNELYHTLLSYPPPPHTLQLAALCCTLLKNYASPSEQCCTELCFTLLSYAVATQLWWTLLSYSAPPMV